MNWIVAARQQYLAYRVFYFNSTLCLFLQWSYLLAASLVIGGVVWNYFQTPSIRQVTYVPVITMGLGLSVMYVMALALITDLIGENKVCGLGKPC